MFDLILSSRKSRFPVQVRSCLTDLQPVRKTCWDHGSEEAGQQTHLESDHLPSAIKELKVRSNYHTCLWISELRAKNLEQEALREFCLFAFPLNDFIILYNAQACWSPAVRGT